MNPIKSLIFVLVLPFCGIAQTQINYSTLQPNDSVWTKANSPYIIRTDFTIPKDMHLTVEAGTEIQVYGKTIFVNGDLNIEGAANEPVLISEIDTTFNTFWEGFQVNLFTGTFKANFLEANGANALIDVRGDYFEPNNILEIKNSRFYDNEVAVVSTYAALELFFEDCVFESNETVIYSLRSNPHLNGCTFNDNSEVLIGMNTLDGGNNIPMFEVDSCIFQSNEVSIIAAKGDFTNNQFLDNGYGLLLYGSVELTRNEFIGNYIALSIATPEISEISQNYFCEGSGDFNIMLNDSNEVDLDVSDNCWCTTDESEIEASIVNVAGDVTFLPLSNACDPNVSLVEENLDLINIYPNPLSNSKILNFNLRKDISEGKLIIVNALGQVVFTENLITGNQQHQTNLEGLESGVYWIQIVGLNQTGYKSPLIVR